MLSCRVLTFFTLTLFLFASSAVAKGELEKREFIIASERTHYKHAHQKRTLFREERREDGGTISHPGSAESQFGRQKAEDSKSGYAGQNRTPKSPEPTLKKAHDDYRHKTRRGENVDRPIRHQSRRLYSIHSGLAKREQEFDDGFPFFIASDKILLSQQNEADQVFVRGQENDLGNDSGLPLKSEQVKNAYRRLAKRDDFEDQLVKRNQHSSPSGGCKFTTFSALSPSALSKCQSITISAISVPAGSTLDLTTVPHGASITFLGTTTFGYFAQNTRPLMAISGSGLTIKAGPGVTFDANGASYWDQKGTNGGKKKPLFLQLHDVHSSTISGLTIKNTPAQAVSINQCTDLTLDHITINDRDGDTKGGHNTDGFDVSSSQRIRITGAVVWNQDDCLSINSGSDIIFSGGKCCNGHGLSIGSVGGRLDNLVQNIRIEHSLVSDSDNGLRIKTNVGTQGLVKNITFADITLNNIKQIGVGILQDYRNDGVARGVPTSGVKISGLKLQGVTGTVMGKANPMLIRCGKNSCNDWDFSKVQIQGGQRANCLNAPQAAMC